MPNTFLRTQPTEHTTAPDKLAPGDEWQGGRGGHALFHAGHTPSDVLHWLIQVTDYNRVKMIVEDLDPFRLQALEVGEKVQADDDIATTESSVEMLQEKRGPFFTLTLRGKPDEVDEEREYQESLYEGEQNHHVANEEMLPDGRKKTVLQYFFGGEVQS